MELDWRKVWADPWKVMGEVINHCRVRGRDPRAYYCQEWGVINGFSEIQLVPLGRVSYGPPCCGESQVDADHLKAWPRLLPVREAGLGEQLRALPYLFPCFCNHQRKDTIWLKAELPDEPAHGTSLYPALAGGWNPKPEMSHCNDLNFLLLAYTGPERINRMYNLRKIQLSSLHCINRELPWEKCTNRGKLLNMRKDGTSKRMGQCIPMGWRD